MPVSDSLRELCMMSMNFLQVLDVERNHSILELEGLSDHQVKKISITLMTSI